MFRKSFIYSALTAFVIALLLMINHSKKAEVTIIENEEKLLQLQPTYEYLERTYVHRLCSVLAEQIIALPGYEKRQACKEIRKLTKRLMQQWQQTLNENDEIHKVKGDPNYEQKKSYRRTHPEKLE